MVVRRHPVFGDKKKALEIKRILEEKLELKFKRLLKKVENFHTIPEGNCDFCANELEKDYIIETHKDGRKFIYCSEKCYNKINKIERELAKDIVINFHKTWNKIFYNKGEVRKLKGRRIA